MYIDKTTNINKVHLPKEVTSSSNKKVSSISEDKTSISEESMLLHKAKNIVLSLPDNRQEKIAEVKSRLDNGEYDSIEGKMLDRIAEKIAQYLLG